MDNFWLSSRQLEATRKSIKKDVKKRGTLLFLGFPYAVLTAKPTEIRMGKGKGKINKSVFQVFQELG